MQHSLPIVIRPPSLLRKLSALLCACILLSTASQARADDFAVFGQHDDSNSAQIDYSVYKKFLGLMATEVNGRTSLYYEAMDDRSAEFFKIYLGELSRIDPTRLSRSEQLAYWLNLKNLLVVSAIVDERPNRSIEKLRGTAQEPGDPWTVERIAVLGVPLSIHSIEQNILLRHFAEPNLIYGIYQGARGGPSLPLEPFIGTKVHEQLRALGETFVNSNRSVRARSKSIEVPELYLWYLPTLFDGDNQRLLSHIENLAEPRLKNRLAGKTEIATRGFSYALDEAQLRLPSYGPGGEDNAVNGFDSYQGGS